MFFRDPWVLFIILIFIPCFGAISFIAFKKQRYLANKLGFSLELGFSSILRRTVFASVIVSLLALGLAQPRLPTTQSVPIRSDTQIAFLFDVSVSMAGSKEPNPCIAAEGPCNIPEDAMLRIDRTKRIIKDVMGSLGIVSVAAYGFSNKIVWQMPFTYSPQLELLDNGLTAGSLQAACDNREMCTNWWMALLAATKEFDPNKKNKIIVLLTDGDSEAFLDEGTHQTLKRLNIKVFSVSIGNNSERIWLYDDNGNTTGYYPKPLPVKDDVLRFVAENSGGRFFTENEADGLAPAILANIGSYTQATLITSRGDLVLSRIFFFAAMVALMLFVLRYVTGVRFTFKKSSLSNKK